MNVESALRNHELTLRTYGGRRLYWVPSAEVWHVVEQKRHARKSRILYEGQSLDDAVTVLIGASEGEIT